MIEGLKLTMTGGELRQRLCEKIRWHEERRDDFERARVPTRDTDSTPARLPDHIIEHMRDEHSSRASVLALIHDHVVEAEVYRLGEGDLVFAELIPKADGG